MPTSRSLPHLTEKDLIHAVSDRQSLAAETKQHLAVCTSCRSAYANLALDLKRLGDVARDLTPQADPSRIAWFGSAWRHAGREPWMRQRPRWPRLAWGVLTCAVLLLLLVGRGSERADTRLPDATREGRFLAEVAYLSENPLPPSFENIVPETVLLDDGFMEFLVPVRQSEQSSSTGYLVS